MLTEEKQLKKYFDYITKHSRNERFRSFMYKTRTHVVVCLLIGAVNNNDKGIAYEEICDSIPSKYASRTTILTILQEGLFLKYLTKEADPMDKRKQLYKLNKPLKSRIISWAKDMNKIFSN